MNLQDIIKYSDLLVNFIAIVAPVGAIFLYLKEQKKLREERRYNAYDALDDKYIDLQQLCLDYPRLDVMDSPIQVKNELTVDEKRQEETILLIRIAIFERAYLMYIREGQVVNQDQWRGWKIEIEKWLTRENLLKVLSVHAPEYDANFIRWVESVKPSN